MDGQNLYHAAREAFGYNYPNYDIKALARVLWPPIGAAPTREYIHGQRGKYKGKGLLKALVAEKKREN